MYITSPNICFCSIGEAFAKAAELKPGTSGKVMLGGMVAAAAGAAWPAAGGLRA